MCCQSVAAENFDTFADRFFTDAQFRLARTDRSIKQVIVVGSEDGPRMCDFLEAKSYLARLEADLSDLGVNVRVQKVKPKLAIATVYVEDSDAYVEQLSFLLREKKWKLYRAESGSGQWRPKYVSLKPCRVGSSYWYGVEKPARTLFPTGRYKTPRVN